MTKVPGNQRCLLKIVVSASGRREKIRAAPAGRTHRSLERRRGAFIFGKQVGLSGPSTFLLGLSKSKDAVAGAGRPPPTAGGRAAAQIK
jgi:hypothetical protein